MAVASAKVSLKSEVLTNSTLTEMPKKYIFSSQNEMTQSAFKLSDLQRSQWFELEKKKKKKIERTTKKAYTA